MKQYELPCFSVCVCVCVCVCPSPRALHLSALSSKISTLQKSVKFQCIFELQQRVNTNALVCWRWKNLNLISSLSLRLEAENWAWILMTADLWVCGGGQRSNRTSVCGFIVSLLCACHLLTSFSFEMPFFGVEKEQKHGGSSINEGVENWSGWLSLSLYGSIHGRVGLQQLLSLLKEWLLI